MAPPNKNGKNFIRRIFTLRFCRTLIILFVLGSSFFTAVFFLLRWFPEKAFEFSSPYFGTIKADAESASNYLAQITGIKDRVEGQRDTIDAAFANAAAAQRASSNAVYQTEISGQQLKLVETNLTSVRKQVSEFDEVIQKAREQLVTVSDDAEKLKTTTEIVTLILSASAGNRQSFDTLKTKTFLISDPLQPIVQQALQAIASDLTIKQMAQVNFAVNWTVTGLDPKTVSLAEVERHLNNDQFIQGTRTKIFNEISNQERFSEDEILDFAASIVRKTPNLFVLSAAVAEMEKVAKMHLSVAGYERYLEWWDGEKIKRAEAKKKTTQTNSVPSN